MPARRGADVILAVCGLGIALYPLALRAGLGDTIPRHVVWFYVGLAWYLLAVLVVVRSPGTRSRVIFIVVVAVVLRLLMIWTHPSLSDDLYRYIWDGKVSLHGINPYRFPPSATELTGLRDAFWQPINAKGQFTPYPPGAQALFALTYLIAGESVRAQQVVATLGDGVAIVLLGLMMRQRRLRLDLLLVYAWSPLALMEYGLSAHDDAWMVAALLGALLLLERSRRTAAAVALAASALLKLFGGVALPALAARWTWRQIAVFGGLIAIAFAPFFVSANPLRDIVFEASDARFNESLYLVLAGAGHALRSAWLPQAVAAGMLLALGALCWLSVRRGGDVVATAFFMVVGLVLVSPVVEPWYALWVLPFVPLYLDSIGAKRWVAIGWLAFSALVVLTELTYAYGPRLWPVIRVTEYVPLFVALGFALILQLKDGGFRGFVAGCPD